MFVQATGYVPLRALNDNTCKRRTFMGDPMGAIGKFLLYVFCAYVFFTCAVVWVLIFGFPEKEKTEA